MPLTGGSVTTVPDHHTRWHEAIDIKDPAFDGVFWVGIASTHIYCRPVCPSRRALRKNRRFFETREAAVTAGFRPCLRCKPEAPRGNTPLDVVSRRATAAAAHIAAGALEGRKVSALASDLGMSERHLRRAIGRITGVTPLNLAVRKRLELAVRLLDDSTSPVSSIAYDSGFQSLRRFNAAFRERFATSPSEWRRRRAHSSERKTG
jgi:AraC family transcriptional regulator of adaptative response / DNA-3-methyladenine glycosylase II